MAETVSFLGSNPLTAVLFLATLSLLPFLFVMVTSFLRIVVVLSILRHAIGTPQLPPTMVITGLALVLSVYVMAPTGTKIWAATHDLLMPSSVERTADSVTDATKKRKGAHADVAPTTLAGSQSLLLFEIMSRAKPPIQEFLAKHATQKHKLAFRDLARRMAPVEHRSAISENDFHVLMPAFVVGELEAAFRIGFLLFLPFLVVDLVVSNVLLALGMHMLSPTTISLPFKLLLFVLVDGWGILTQSLVLSYV